MPRETIGKIPEFGEETSLDTESKVQELEEVKEAETEEVLEKEKETLSELPAEEKPTGEPSVDTGELLQAVSSLEAERKRLLGEIQTLREQRREIKEAKPAIIEEKLDDLKDLPPDEIAVIDRILKAKGYVTRTESDKKMYDVMKQYELNKFLEKYPEYKPENDPNDLNWNSLQRELGFYRMPDNPNQIGELLEKARKSIKPVSSDRGIPIRKRQAEIAGVGAGGAQRSSSRQTLPPRYRQELERGGWSEEEIKEMESTLEE